MRRAARDVKPEISCDVGPFGHVRWTLTEMFGVIRRRLLER